MSRRTAVVAFVATVLTLAPWVPSQAAGEKPLRYVALGDSYSAASGVPPLDPTAPLRCARSAATYPHIIAARAGAGLADVTCAGAETRDYFKSQYDRGAPQLEALSERTQLVTMTIGGNNNNTF